DRLGSTALGSRCTGPRGAGRPNWRPRPSTSWTASRCTPSRCTAFTGTPRGRRRRRWCPALWRRGVTFPASCTCQAPTSGGTARTRLSTRTS
ncbi:unnamed protein product, partial [Ectocarpus sp. 12 AP-2014]